jgi:hypothetical protein
MNMREQIFFSVTDTNKVIFISGRGLYGKFCLPPRTHAIFIFRALPGVFAKPFRPFGDKMTVGTVNRSPCSPLPNTLKL